MLISNLCDVVLMTRRSEDHVNCNVKYTTLSTMALVHIRVVV